MYKHIKCVYIKGKYIQTCSLNYTNNYQYNMCLRAYAPIFLTCPKKHPPKFLHLHHQGRCFSYSVSLNLAWNRKRWGKTLHEPSLIQQEMGVS